MAETDVFERRLRAALVRHVADGPTEFDALGFARLVAATEPRRHGLGAILGWRRVGVPRLAWVLLIAALLTAMVAGTLAVGSQLLRWVPAVVPPLPPAFVCPPGSTPDRPGPADQARPPVWTRMAFDRGAGRLIALAQEGPGGSATWKVETWTFDVCTNTWTQMHPNREPQALISGLTYDIDSDLTIGVHYEDWQDPYVIGNVWAYDLDANTWTELGMAPTDATGFYDPVSGLVVTGGAVNELWNYDVEADSWTPIPQSIPREPLDTSQYVYDASTDRIVAYAGSETWLLDLRTGTWSQSSADTPVFRMGWWALPTILYDEAAERTVVAANNQWGAYDATTDRWEILFSEAYGRLGAPAMVYDPTNRRLIVPGGGIGVSGDMVAFDLVTREWTVLLEPSEG